MDACRGKISGETVYQHQSKLIRDTIENVTIAKKTYKSFYKQITNNLTLCLIICLIMSLKKLLMIYILKTICKMILIIFLDRWCEFYFHKGRFPGSQELIIVPQAQIPPFVKTQTLDLYQNFKATDARALVSIQALAALNINFGGDKTISKRVFSKFLHNLSFEALSKETDDFYLNFDFISDLVIYILEGFAKNKKNKKTSNQLL